MGCHGIGADHQHGLVQASGRLGQGQRQGLDAPLRQREFVDGVLAVAGHGHQHFLGMIVLNIRIGAGPIQLQPGGFVKGSRKHSEKQN